MALSKQQRTEMDEAQTALARNRRQDKQGRSFCGAIVWVVESLEKEIKTLKARAESKTEPTGS